MKRIYCLIGLLVLIPMELIVGTDSDGIDIVFRKRSIDRSQCSE